MPVVRVTCKGIVWANATHPVDGMFVEVKKLYGKLWFGVESRWFPTQAECEEWALELGAQVLEIR